MFCNQKERYMTRGIMEAVHPEVTHLLWHLIDRLKDKEMELDYHYRNGMASKSSFIVRNNCISRSG